MKTKLKILAAAAISIGLMTESALAEDIKIGFNVPLTGFAASDGKSAQNGAELA